MIRVVHLMGVQNGWAICLRVENLTRALAEHVEAKAVSFRQVRESGLPDGDFVHVHGLQIIRLVSDALSAVSCPWGFEVISHRSLKDIRKYEITRSLMARAACCWVKNKRLAPEVAQLVSGEPIYVPNGVDTALFRPRPVRIGWVGNRKNVAHAEYKGLPMLDDAISRLNDARLAGRLRFQFIDAPGSYPHIVTQAELVPYYQSLDLYVSMSIAEGCSNTINEAVSCGVPVVATKVGIVPEFIADGANVIGVERNVDSLVNGILKAVAGRTDSVRVMDAYDWVSPAVADAYLTEYRNAIAEATA